MNSEPPNTLPPDFLGVADGASQASEDDATSARIVGRSEATDVSPVPSVASGSVLRNTQFRRVATSRFCSNLAQDGITYGAVVATVSAGGTPFQTALIGAASVIPAATIGVYGGAIADALPKRTALVLGYLGQAAVCLAVPLLFGTDAIAMIALILLVNVAGQVSGPAESAIVPLVVPEAQLGRAASTLSFAGAAGSAGGTAVLAPILVTLFGVRPLFFVAAFFLAMSMAQVIRLPAAQRTARGRMPVSEVGYRASLLWLLDHPSVATMLLVSAIAGTSTKILQTLSPGYVHTVFDLNPAKSVYIFAPTGVGMVVALIVVPWLLHLIGERAVALIGVLMASLALVLLGIITQSTELLAPLNPFLSLRRLDPGLSPEVLTAAALSVPVGFGVNATAMAVTVYIQKRVRRSYQGRAFALDSVLKNLVTIGPLLLVGAVASAIGEQWVLFVLPAVLVVATGLLIRWSYRLTGRAKPPRKEIIGGFLHESDEPATDRISESPD